jgi:hypothetical protein
MTTTVANNNSSSHRTTSAVIKLVKVNDRNTEKPGFTNAGQLNSHFSHLLPTSCKYACMHTEM